MELVEIMPIVGCSVSAFARLVTCWMILISWRHVKSFSAVVVMSMGFAFIVVNIFYAVAINKIEEKDEALCMATAAILHYFQLVGAFLVCAQSLQAFVYVIPSCYSKKNGVEHFLLPVVGWLVPAATVSVSLGIIIGLQDVNDYKSDEYCWLNLDKPVVYSLIGPAAGAFLITIICLTVVLTKASRSKRLTSELQSKLTPLSWNVLLLALEIATWVLAGTSLETTEEVFHYVFAGTNCLTGIMFLIAHWLANKKVMKAMLSGQQPKSKVPSALGHSVSGNEPMAMEVTAPSTSSQHTDNDKHYLVDSDPTMTTGLEGPMSNHDIDPETSPPPDEAYATDSASGFGAEGSGANVETISPPVHYSWSRHPSLADAAAARRISPPPSEGDPYDLTYDLPYEMPHDRRSTASIHQERPLPQSYRTGLMRYT